MNGDDRGPVRRSGAHSAAATSARIVEPAAILAVGAALLAVALAENTLLPWAPFYFVYAALTTTVPFVAGTHPFGRPGRIRPSTWLLVAILPLALQAFGAVWMASLYPAVAEALGAGPVSAADPFHSFNVAFAEVFQRVVESWGGAVAGYQLTYLALVVAWAGLGEELFFRGYVHGGLRRRFSFAVAAGVSALLFGLRHATQLGLLWPDYPWGAAASWVTFSTVVGLAMSWLYEREGSLWPPVVAHYLFNLVPVAALLAG